MSSIQKFYTGRVNQTTSEDQANGNIGNTFVGEEGRLWFNPDDNTFRLYGNIPGGVVVGGGGNGVPVGPTNSIQYNAGNGNFGGTANLTIVGNGISVVGNTASAYFIGNGSQLTGLPEQTGTYSNANVQTYLPTYTGNLSPEYLFTDNYLYANGNSIFDNTTFTGNVSLGNLYITDQTIGGKNIDGNVNLLPEGSGWVNTPKLSIDGMTIANTGTTIQFISPGTVDIEFSPGTGGNIITTGNIIPVGNSIASLGDPVHRYTDLWIGTGNINIIDQSLSQNQQIYANNGNLIIANSSGLTFGNFEFYGNTMALANVAADLVIGTANATGTVQFNRAIEVSTTVGSTAFQIDRNGLTNIYTPTTISNTQSALNIIGSSSGNSQPRSPTFTGTMLQITGQDDTPARISIDSFGASGAQNSYATIASRTARGTVDAPTALQADDLMMRITNQAWTGNGVYAPSIARLNFAAAENFTSNASVGTYANIQLTPIGSNIIKTVTGFSANGVSFPGVGAGGTGNLGITFQDGTFQNTAYSNTTVVTSLTAASGISLSPAAGPNATGDITITNIGILGVTGTANQVVITSNVSGAVTLGTPQNIGTSSNVQFYGVTVTDLTILGNVSNVIPSVVDGNVIYVANTAVNYADIDNSGLVTGSTANGNYAGILYDTDTSTWNFSIGNSQGITAGNVYGNAGQFLDLVHVGYANAVIDYPNASLQADCNTDGYNQIVIQNHNQGANASADFVAVANNGDDGNFYIDMGINSNVYNNADYAATSPNDGYLYVNGGNLVIGTQTPTKTIKFFTGGTDDATAYNRAVINDTGLVVIGNIIGNNISSNNLTSGGAVSATGNVTGSYIFALNQVSAQGNVIGQNLTTSGVVLATGNVTGGNIRTTGSVSATGNVVAGNLVTATTTIDGGVSTSGNVTATNYFGSSLSVSGNITGASVIAGAQIISPLISVTGNITGGNILTGGLISTTGNVTTGNLRTQGSLSSIGNIDSGNIRTAGLVTATGNISGSYIVGNGSQLTGINAFQTVVANGTNLLAGSTSGVLTLTPGNNIIITGNATTDTANIAVNDNPTFGNVSVTGNITTANLTVAGISNLNANANVKITGGANAQALITDGLGNLSWANVANIAGAPATQIVTTWVPTLTATGGGTFTYSVQSGYYIKSGQSVTAYFTISITGVTGVSGTVRLSNLPATSINQTNAGGGALDDYSFTALPSHVTGLVAANSTYMAFYWHSRISNNNTMGLMTTTQLGTTATLIGRVTYISAL